MRSYFFAILMCVFALPTASHANVLISEIAWMGSDINSTFEWIELYNFSTTTTDLSGWELTSDDGNISVQLSGILTPHGVCVLERGTDQSVPEVDALLTYPGEMSDAGTHLTLKDSAGLVSDQANGSNGWVTIGGSNVSPKKTAQRTRTGGWVTAAPTPGLANAQVDDPVVPDPNVTSTKNPSGGSMLRTIKQQDTIFSIGIVASSTVYVGMPVNFTTSFPKLSKRERNTLTHYWNFGDTWVTNDHAPSHVFKYPGEYIVSLEASTTRKQSLNRFEIMVLPGPFSLSLNSNRDVVITNETDGELKLDGYTLVGDDYNYSFPKNSFMKAKGAITIPRATTGNTHYIELRSSENEVRASLSLDQLKKIDLLVSMLQRYL
ncbi:MAG: lamin tail domain-containing protein [Candidatus Pacebacteria bacterium]|nr:lamin tail domain-containing protein [Candidatus Paceibacterota bacterium]